MRTGGELLVAAGLSSRTGRRADNQDFVASYLGTPAERVTHGAIAVLADGVGGAKGGRVAAELACRCFIEFYLSQPETIGIAANADGALRPYNAWLHAIGGADPALTGAATTFAAVILRGREAHALHVGDSRVWHWRDGGLTQLTEDHAGARPDQRHVLYRAVGMEPGLRLDHAVQPLLEHDRLLITSDGVHGVLSARVLSRLLAARGAAEEDSGAITAAALAAGSTDNASAIILDVLAVPGADHAGLAAVAADLPILPPPAIGDSVDGFKLDRLLSDGRYSRLFAASAHDGSVLVLKFPKPALLSEHGARLAFTRESLIGAGVRNAYVAEVLAIPRDRQSRLYVALRFYQGETLETRIGRGPLPYAAGLAIAAGIARGVASLHRLRIIHRDIKPDNVLLTPSGPRLLDLGVAGLPDVQEFADDEIPGTPSYMAPEMYDGETGNEATDQFALGVTLFRAFTGRYPYGEVEPFSRKRFHAPENPIGLRPDMPAWLAATLRRAVAIRPEDRFGDVLELLEAIERGSARAAPLSRRRPLIERDPVRFWQVVSAVLAIALATALVAR